ncbi:flavin reductase family protein [Maricaulis sp.]|uniref:flavin reductase family protein n=1 Tax=Maricaulis sp. TaxID=1486257 RepID=UPI003A901D56
MIDNRAFRDALGCYPTGVTIVSTYSGGTALGMTVNSFASVSLDPPLVLWSIERSTHRYDLLRNARDYAINILAHDQREMAEACAQEADLALCGASWTGDVAPMIDGAVARLVCRQHAVHAGGDHDIIIGEVIALDTPRTVASLVFVRGGYGEAG